MKKINNFDWFAFILLIVGGIAWGIIGIFGYNVFEVFFGANSIFARILDISIGLSALYILFFLVRSIFDK